ncbi:MAG: insulinase family protein [Alphaproteobacteria bacterium]|nr:insulinase family protein [Alphaproteobacteria bacterium]
MPGLETASLGVYVDAGARHETPTQHGIAHLLEHMAFKGTATRGARDIAETIEAVGGHLNAYTSRDQTAYLARVLKADVPLAIELLADILQHSTFDPAELDKERAVVIQEIGEAEDSPDDIVFDHLQEAAFPDQPLGRPILGTRDTVAGFAADDLRGFLGHHYRRRRLVLAGAGALEHERVVELASRAFDILPRGDATRTEIARYAGGDRRQAKELEQVHLALAFPGVPIGDADYDAVQLFSILLGGGMSSRLFQEVRENRGLCYSVYSFAQSYADCGLFGIGAGTGEGEVAELVAVAAEVSMAAAESATVEELARARAQLKAGMMMALESSSARCEQLGRHMLLYRRVLSKEEMLARVDAVDIFHVRRAAKRVLKGARLTLSALGPIGRLETHDRVAARFG